MSKEKRKLNITAIVLYGLAIILLAVGYFSFHKNAPSPTPNIPIYELTTVRGVIKPIAAKVTSIATHILTMDDGNVVILNANGNDLTDYEGKKVDVNGKFEKKTEGKDIFIVSDIDLVDEDSNAGTTVKPALTWKKYDSSNVGISFKYRDDFIVEEQNREIVVKIPVQNPETGKMIASELTDKVVEKLAIEPVMPEFDIIDFVLVLNKKQMTLDEYVATLNDPSLQKSKIGQDSTSAYKRILPDSKIEFYVSREDKMIYRISYAPQAKKTYDPNQNLFYEIITELKFIPLNLKGPFVQ